MRNHSRCLFAGALAFGLASFCPAADPVKPQAGGIPSSFQAWMVTGKHAGRYHSPVCDHGLDPVVLVFLREVEGADQPTVDLLKKLDELAANHPDVKLGVCAVFLNDGGLHEALGKSGEDYVKKFSETTTAKRSLEDQLRGLAKEKGLEKTEIGLDTTAGPPGYQIDENSQVTVVFYNDHHILDRKSYPKDKLNEGEVKKIVGEVGKTVTALEGRLRKRGNRQ